MARYGLGMWNPAGAKTAWFVTEEKRQQAALHYSRTGWTCWFLNLNNSHE